MNHRRLSDKDLADFAANVITQLGGTTLEAINAEMRTELAALIGSLPDDLATQSSTANVLEAMRKAAVSTKNASRDQLLSFMSQVKNALVAGQAPREQYDICGFDFRTTTVGPYIAQDPTDLSAFGYSNGVNIVKFKGNNSLNSVVYEIWRRQGDTGEWTLLTTTKKQTFIDAPVRPGQYYEYKARARAAKTISHFSNSAVLYGL